MPGTRPNLLTIDSQDWSRYLVGRASPWIDCDAACDDDRRDSASALSEELSWAAHVELPAVLLRLRHGRVAGLARALLAWCKAERSTLSLWLRVPMQAPAESPEEPWLWWHRLSRLCDLVLDQLGLALEVTPDLPEPDALRRWFAEPVKALVLPTHLFLTNRQGFPVLSKAHQQLVSDLFKLRPQVIITGSCRHDKGMESYMQYVKWLRRHTTSDLYTSHGRSYEDVLQEPLQPLADNLRYSTYEVFEMDPYKYRAYREAVRLALVEMRPETGTGEAANSSEGGARWPPVTIAVLGAGRGPLVQECLNAAAQCGRPVRVFAVEKNDCAVNTLLNRQLDEWPDCVTVLPTDMRRLGPKDLQADIFVSELLGSFGDNELSPECLDGAMQCLAKGGVSIPQEYTSYLAPMHSSTVYRGVTRQRDPEKPYYTFLETPYVVNLVNCELLAQPQAAFTFRHPKSDGDPESNERRTELRFTAGHAGVLHGFAGYFDSRLYGPVRMSILPESHSPDLFSWFPLVFPLHHPVPVRAGDPITIVMWRVVTERSVWYEWALLEPMVLPIHNPSGRSFTINLM